MNYYIQGDAANADRIKAAWEKLGIKYSGYDFSRKDVLFFTLEAKGKLYMMSSVIGSGLDNIIKTHPDYKELELPAEPKFKLGDKISWINHDCGIQTITDIRDDSYITVDKYGVRCALKFVNQDEWELVPKPHYGINNFKAGMPVLVRDYDNTQWRYVQFSHCVGKDNPIMFNACGNTWKQCIPFEGNEHLLGTTDMPSEEYINW